MNQSYVLYKKNPNQIKRTHDLNDIQTATTEFLQ